MPREKTIIDSRCEEWSFFCCCLQGARIMRVKRRLGVKEQVRGFFKFAMCDMKNIQVSQTNNKNFDRFKNVFLFRIQH